MGAEAITVVWVVLSISITVAFVVLIALLPGLIVFFEDYIGEMFKDLWLLMMELANG